MLKFSLQIIAQNLPLNEVTTVEFTSTQPGSYEFTCGMNIFRGVMEVQAVDSTIQTTGDILSVAYRTENSYSIGG